MTELRGNNLFNKDWAVGRTQFMPQMMAQEQKEQPHRKLALPHNSLQSLSVSFAADAALPELASSVTQDVVLHRNPRILFHSLKRLKDANNNNTFFVCSLSARFFQ